jgi:hypothetical protein
MSRILPFALFARRRSRHESFSLKRSFNDFMRYIDVYRSLRRSVAQARASLRHTERAGAF